MHIMQSRRDFLASVSLAGAAAALGSGTSLADKGPPETTTIRLRFEDAPPTMVSGVAEIALCNAPIYITEDPLHAEGFTDIHYVPVKSGVRFTEAFARSEVDFGLMFAPGAVRRLDAGVLITVLAGVHPGCLELFVQGPIRNLCRPQGETRRHQRGALFSRSPVRVDYGRACRARPRNRHQLDDDGGRCPPDGLVRPGQDRRVLGVGAQRDGGTARPQHRSCDGGHGH
jgi:hypothetical protein